MLASLDLRPRHIVGRPSLHGFRSGGMRGANEVTDRAKDHGVRETGNAVECKLLSGLANGYGLAACLAGKAPAIRRLSTSVSRDYYDNRNLKIRPTAAAVMTSDPERSRRQTTALDTPPAMTNEERRAGVAQW